MSVTAEQVEAARKEAEAAKTASEKAHKDAGTAKAEADKARKKAEASRKKAGELGKKAGTLEGEADTLEGQARASAEQCTAARTAEGQAASRATGEEARASRIQALYPNECNEETAAADRRAEEARAKANAAAAEAKKKCDKAAKDAKEAEAARKKATTARQEATDADTAADTDERTANTAADTARTRSTEAVAAALLASLLNSRANGLAREFENGQICVAPTPRDPFTDDTAPITGAPPAPRRQGGCQSDTTANFVTGAQRGIFFYGGHNYKKIEGKLVEVTVGQKITNVLIFDSSLVIGGKLEEVAGWESKLVLGGDRRKIFGARWERNMFLKAESVMGDSIEHVLSGQAQHVPTVNGGSNPSNRVEICPKVESKAAKLVEQHKAKLTDLRKKVSESVQSSKKYFDSVNSRVSTHRDEIGRINAEITQLTQKLDALKVQAANYQMKSDGYIKMVASGTVKLKAGSFKGSAKAKYHKCVKALAEFVGQVKWN